MSHCDAHESEGGHPDEVCASCGTCIQCTGGGWGAHLHGACMQPKADVPTPKHQPNWTNRGTGQRVRGSFGGVIIENWYMGEVVSIFALYTRDMRV